MEAENGVAAEEEKRVIGVTTKENIKKEVENNNNGAEIQTKNEESKPTVETKGPISTGDNGAVEASKTTSTNKNSKRAKVLYMMHLNYLFKLKY